MADTSFAGAGKVPGLELWRVENRGIVKQRQANGKFHTGDSYILLSTTQQRAGGALSWAIHFWLGAETSTDEQGIAAYKTVELDDALGGGPVQHREVQGNESQAFLALFKSFGGVEYLPGGIESGFRHVDRDAHTTRLLQVKGKRTVRYWEVPLSNASLNTGDVFILDAGAKIFIYNGATANKYEKLKGIEVATRIKDSERGGKPVLVFLDESPEDPEFWGALGGRINVTNAGAPDEAVEHVAARAFRISDAGGAGVQFTPVELPDGKLRKSILDTNDVFLIDVGSKVFVWVGRGASPSEKREGMMRAAAYLRDHRAGANVPVERVGEGAESALFKAEFILWDAGLAKPSAQRTTAAAAADTPVDVTAYLERQKAADTPVDDGSGRLLVYRIENFELAAVPREKYGQFYGGDSYVLSYTYIKKGSSKEEMIVYFWQGESSTADEKGAAALQAKSLDDKAGGKAVQVRVVQGKEPAHFRQLFRGNMVVHSGGHASGFKNRTEGDSYDTDGIALFLVKGSSALNTYAKQVAEKASSLCSADAFVLVTPTQAFAWQGRGASSDEQAMAVHLATKLAGEYNGTGGRAVVPVHEGSEPGEFWTALGGQGEYAAVHDVDDSTHEPRLFHCSNATGTFRVEEIDQFQQEDLLEDDVMILDVFSQLFVWVGAQSNAAESAKAMEFAQAFVNNATDGRSTDIPIVRITSGSEPGMFTSFFHGWDENKANKNKFEDPYEKRLQAEKAKKAAAAPAAAAPVAHAAAPVAAAAAPAAAVAVASGAKHSYEELKAGVPAGVDPSRKEDYLDDATFTSKFGVSRADFAAQPKWRRDAKKKELGLF